MNNFPPPRHPLYEPSLVYSKQYIRVLLWLNELVRSPFLLSMHREPLNQICLWNSRKIADVENPSIKLRGKFSENCGCTPTVLLVAFLRFRNVYERSTLKLMPPTVERWTWYLVINNTVWENTTSLTRVTFRLWIATPSRKVSRVRENRMYALLNSVGSIIVVFTLLPFVVWIFLFFSSCFLITSMPYIEG